MERTWIFLTFVSGFIIGLVLTQDLPPDGSDNVCSQQETCGRCISASYTCAWCQQAGYDEMNRTRCDHLMTLIDNGCQDSVIYPTHVETLIRNEEPRDSNPAGDAVQLAPQEVKVAIRPRLEYDLKATFRLARDYPVDLYCVMDLSNTMKRSKAKLATLGTDLARTMRNITANFKLGFGSYIDKRISPYASIIPSKMENPCSTSTCVPTYGFKNHLPLTTNAQLFSDTVNASRISGNLDTPEGTFDAIMQAVACKDPIGWRDVSRKILLVSTDSIYHTAGDGKLAGIVTPNDGLCHLDENNEYNMSLYQDYPSVSHLAHRIGEEKINVIFGIVWRNMGSRAVEDAYRPLTKLIPGSAFVTMDADSGNIVDVIQQNYEKISSKVELKDDSPDWVDIAYYSSCKVQEPSQETSTCEGLRVGENVTFSVRVNVTECPADPADRQLDVTVQAVGLADKLVLHLDIQCECPCEQPDHSTPPEENSAFCNGSGTFECGACTCNPGTSGRQCTCDESNAKCKRQETSEVCSGRGSCECGSCVCDQLSAKDPNKVYSGPYCECDDYSCDNYRGKLCGGPELGVCSCGKCECNVGYTGSACSCPTSTDMCLGTNQIVCSGHGQCECGKCRCDPGYQGKTCHSCPSCPGDCEMNKDCVQCATFGTGPYSSAQCKANCSHVVPVDSINKDDTADTLVCKFRDPEDECYYYFSYTYSSQLVHSQLNKECPEPVNKIGIIVGVVVTITVVGIVLLVIWKIIITIYDRREYEKFQRVRSAERWQVEGNPLYKPTTSTFQNPTFDKPKQN